MQTQELVDLARNLSLFNRFFDKSGRLLIVVGIRIDVKAATGFVTLLDVETETTCLALGLVELREKLVSGELTRPPQKAHPFAETALHTFFEIINELYVAGAVKADVHYRLESGQLMLNLPKLYGFYEERYRQLYRGSAFRRQEIQDALASLFGTTWFRMGKSIRFRLNGHSGESMPYQNCCSLDYAKVNEAFGLLLR